jgi:hypothetical protein
MTKFTTELKPGQSIVVGDTTITMERKSGRVARLVIQADENTKIITPARRSASPSKELESTHG